MDSLNIQHWSFGDAEVPKIYMKRVKERMRAGIKPTNEFMMKMSIQGIFDARRSIIIL
jgi:hypothetical protein